MLLQILCITNDYLVIYKTLKTWSCASRIVIFANGNNKNLIKEELKDIQNCFVIIGDFIGFSETRNLLITLAQTDKFDYNIMIDDSYELHGDLLKELKKQNLNHGLIRIKSGKELQNRKLIFKKGQYTGNIHETLIEDGPAFQLENVYIEDVIYKHQVIRSYKRADYDLEMLKKEPKNRRTDYYTAALLMKKGQFKKALVIFNELIKVKDYYSSLSEKSIELINSGKLEQLLNLVLERQTIN